MGSLSENRNSVGTPRTPYLPARSPWASTSTDATTASVLAAISASSFRRGFEGCADGDTRGGPSAGRTAAVRAKPPPSVPDVRGIPAWVDGCAGDMSLPHGDLPGER